MHRGANSHRLSFDNHVLQVPGGARGANQLPRFRLTLRHRMLGEPDNSGVAIPHYARRYQWGTIVAAEYLTIDGVMQDQHETGAFADKMNSIPKCVTSRTLKEPAWNATLIEGDVVDEVGKLKSDSELAAGQPRKELRLAGTTTGKRVVVLDYERAE
jgi:hypothetical protein